MTSNNNRFENQFGSVFNANYAFSFWKARVALYAILRSMGIGSGDEVILPGYTCVMDVNPIKYVGAKPIYVDIEPETFNMVPALIEKKITPNTKLIMAQHTYGYPCDMDRLLDIAHRHQIPVIEDCCLSLGSTYKGKRARALLAARPIFPFSGTNPSQPAWAVWPSPTTPNWPRRSNN
ncbi:MAG: DegT/DnrJ/EryC1/StrS family aminotransferase [Planctomycetota bacterium]|jgi:perosamine synthetase